MVCCLCVLPHGSPEFVLRQGGLAITSCDCCLSSLEHGAPISACANLALLSKPRLCAFKVAESMDALFLSRPRSWAFGFCMASARRAVPLPHPSSVMCSKSYFPERYLSFRQLFAHAASNIASVPERKAPSGLCNNLDYNSLDAETLRNKFGDL